MIANGKNFIWGCMRVCYEWILKVIQNKVQIEIIHVRKHQVIVESFKVTDDLVQFLILVPFVS